MPDMEKRQAFIAGGRAMAGALSRGGDLDYVLALLSANADELLAAEPDVDLGEKLYEQVPPRFRGGPAIAARERAAARRDLAAHDEEMRQRRSGGNYYDQLRDDVKASEEAQRRTSDVFRRGVQ